jgi:hypothetical protein
MATQSSSLRPRCFLTLRPFSRLSVNPDCVSAFNELKLGRGGPKYIIFKISDDQKEIVVDEIGKEADYDSFREKLIAKKEKTGKDRPSYAIYDVEFELEGGEGKRCVQNDCSGVRDSGWSAKVIVQIQDCFHHLHQPRQHRCKGISTPPPETNC